MKPVELTEKLKELALYTEQHETITIYELSTLFGSSLTTYNAFLLSLPLLLFSNQWVALPLCFLILLCSIWYFFDEPLWMPDFIKRVSFPSPLLQKLVKRADGVLSSIKAKLPKASFYEEHISYFHKMNALLLGFLAFQVGFLESPETTWRSVLSLIFISFGATIDESYICFMGYVFFILALI